MKTDCPVILLNDTRADLHHGCTAVMSVIELFLHERNMTVVGRWPTNADWKNDPRFYDALTQSRLVIVNGEGTIHHDRMGGRRLLAVGEVAKAAGVPVALINTGWEANSPELANMLVNFSLISARDQASAIEMRASGQSVRVVPDLSLNTIGILNKQRSGIGVTDNVDRFRTLELAKHRYAVEGRWVSIHHRQPWIKFLRGGISLRNDLKSPHQLAAILAVRHALWRVSQNDLTEFVSELASLELLISGRFHACTLALVAGTPFVSQASNTHKIASLIKDAGLASWRSELKDASESTYDLNALKWTEAEQKSRRDYLDHARATAKLLFDDLRNLVH